MTARSWLRNLFATRKPRTIRRAPAHGRLGIETLEDRLNLSPTITSFSVPASAPEGYVQLSAAATDPAGPVSFRWDVRTLTRDGASSNPIATYSGSSVSALLDGNADYLVSVTAFSRDGTSAGRGTSLSVTNVAPTITSFTVPTKALPNSVISANAQASDPANAPGRLPADSLTYQWTFTPPAGSGVSSGTSSNPNATFTVGNPGTYTLILRVTDDSGATATQFAKVIVAGTPPTIASNQAAVAVNEGTQATNSGTFDDLQGRNTVTLTASLGTVTKDDAAGTWNWKYDAADNTTGPTPVTITATDTEGRKAITSFALTALNVAPTLSTYTVQGTGVEGVAVALNATAADPAGAADPLTYTWTVTRPDSTTVTLSGASASFTPTVAGNYGVSLTVSDGDGGSVTRTSTLSGFSLSASQKFVGSLYNAELGRNAGASEVAGWVNVLGGPGGQSAVVAGIVNSTEARIRVVKGWYQTYLGRTASAMEANGWANVLGSQTEEKVLSQILGSMEFYVRAQMMNFGGTMNQNFVRALYGKVLGRTPSSDELASQVAALQQVGPQGVALSILQSVEYRANVVRGYYSSLLHRSGSQEEVASHVNSGLDLRAIRMSIESSLEYFVNG